MSSFFFLLSKYFLVPFFEEWLSPATDKMAIDLVNKGCTTKQLLELSEEIRNKVKQLFGIILHIEPVVVSN